MSTHTKDETMPEGKWIFDESVAACFDDMLQRSIPELSTMRRLVFALGARCLLPQSLLVDLGCSHGEALLPFVRKYGAAHRYIGIEVSEPMRRAATLRFAPWVHSDLYGTTHLVDVAIRALDLRHAYPQESATLTLAILTLMFIPLEYRMHVLESMARYTRTAIIVEKVLGSSGEIDDLFVECYYDFKREQGYSQEAIDRKRLALEGVLMPLTVEANETLFRQAGFHTFDCFWRWNNFCGWILRQGR